MYILSQMNSPPMSHPSKLSKSTGFEISANFTQPISTGYLILHMVIYICFNATLSIHPTFSFPHYVHQSDLYACVSNAALQLGLSVLIILDSISMC